MSRQQKPETLLTVNLDPAVEELVSKEQSIWPTLVCAIGAVGTALFGIYQITNERPADEYVGTFIATLILASVGLIAYGHHWPTTLQKLPEQQGSESRHLIISKPRKSNPDFYL